MSSILAFLFCSVYFVLWIYLVPPFVCSFIEEKVERRIIVIFILVTFMMTCFFSYITSLFMSSIVFP